MDASPADTARAVTIPADGVELPGTLDQVVVLARDWFVEHLSGASVDLR